MQGEPVILADVGHIDDRLHDVLQELFAASWRH
jgi:hypothetical protein